MTQQEIRENTMQLIFQMDMAGEFDYKKLTPIAENLDAVTKKQAIRTLEAIRDHIDEIDKIISDNTEKWSIDRFSKTDLAILRNAVAEMMYVDSIPAPVSINEAVELARKYGDNKSYAFVNSVLGKIDRSLQG